VQADKIVDVVRFLRDDPGCRFVSLIDVTAVDYPKREKRFDVVYHLLSGPPRTQHPDQIEAALHGCDARWHPVRPWRAVLPVEQPLLCRRGQIQE
jgi:hypothetical protein